MAQSVEQSKRLSVNKPTDVGLTWSVVHIL